MLRTPHVLPLQGLLAACLMALMVAAFGGLPRSAAAANNCDPNPQFVDCLTPPLDVTAAVEGTTIRLRWQYDDAIRIHHILPVAVSIYNVGAFGVNAALALQEPWNVAQPRTSWSIGELGPGEHAYRVCLNYHTNVVYTDGQSFDNYPELCTLLPTGGTIGGMGTPPTPIFLPPTNIRLSATSDLVRVDWDQTGPYERLLVHLSDTLGNQDQRDLINHPNGYVEFEGMRPGARYRVILKGCHPCGAWSADQFITTDLAHWQVLDDNDATREIVAAGGNLYQRHESGAVWKYTGTPKVWQLIDDNRATASIAADGGDLYQVHDTGHVWKYSGTPMVWQPIDHNPATASIAAAGGNVYQRHKSGAVWKYTGTPMVWQLIDENPATSKIVAAGGSLYQLHHNGFVWKYTGTPKIWQLLDDNTATVGLTAGADSLYQMHKSGHVWKYTGTPKVWQLIDENPATREIVAAGGSLYQLHHNGHVWKYTGTPKVWQHLDDNASTAAIAADGTSLYQIHHSGVVWKYPF